ncbi:hypothetical protein MNBD_GAMMA21-1857 [hydrothermal vent metagenome]|uniref:Transporter n=1 Tax=hydrothermal vent metagenome TaxID=652676 RepID=A0A3B1B7V2_9ZZZZ
MNRYSILILFAVFINSSVQAQENSTQGTSTEELAKAAQNPIAAMFSLPLQLNTNFGVGPKDDPQYILNIQPVVPFGISKD